MAYSYLSSLLTTDNQDKFWALDVQYPQGGMSSGFADAALAVSSMAAFPMHQHQQQALIPGNSFSTMVCWQAPPPLYPNTDCCTALSTTAPQGNPSLFCSFPLSATVPPPSPAATTCAASVYYGSTWSCDESSNTTVITSPSVCSSPSPILHPVTPPPTNNTLLSSSSPPPALLSPIPRKKKESAGAPYECCECKKQFTRPYNLKSHMRTHTNERPYVCKHPNCTWKFARPHDLKRHELLHSGHKPHACPVCPKRFARCDALKRHWKVDAGCAQRIEALHHMTPKKYRK
ncbi:hypothetical protein EC973_003371 [Apophysomyces ossiformis]|uniref:C2H2-type domain-containing protein n=1 Tax=Apophysomyces ossiformis TaxID=679940 RepID=A0A8H7BXV5_9FUNG|nr:hypothetical protein EC973_003371 [Apophysomyces ossiformis]